MCTHPTRFRNQYELAKLPFFDIERGRLVLASDELGPAIDCHTHLALAYVLAMQVDLHRSHDQVQHYLPMNTPLDLDVYANKNFTPAQLKEMSRDLTVRSVGASGMRETHTVPNLLTEMKELGIRASVLLPIDFPVLSDNAGTYLKEAGGRDDLIVFGSVHPWAPGVVKKLDRQVALGARGIKVHPAVQLIRPDHPRAMRLYRLCGERGLPVLFHCGPVGIEPRLGRYMSQLRHYRAAVAEHPDTTFLLGHSGALQMEQALALARKHPNVYLELASQGLPNIREIVDRAPPERIVFGTDWPFYHQAAGLAKVLIATEGMEDRRRQVLHDNAARLFDLPTL